MLICCDDMLLGDGAAGSHIEALHTAGGDIKKILPLLLVTIGGTGATVSGAIAATTGGADAVRSTRKISE